MLFKKKNKICNNCNTKINGGYSFCPYCGASLVDREKYLKDYGLLGKGEEFNYAPKEFNLGIADKIIGSLMSSLIKNLDRHFQEMDKDFERGEVMSLPNGVRIRIGHSTPIKKKSQKSFFQKSISKEQLERMSSLPRTKAETTVKRLNNKIIYELNASGIESPDDIFISKLESGYEIKAIGDKSIYVNSLPVNLPLKSLSLGKDRLFIEFYADNVF